MRPDKTVTMKIISSLRQLWLRAGENRKEAKEKMTVPWVEGRARVGRKCKECGKLMRDKENGKCPYDFHHLIEVRDPPWDINNPDWSLFINRLFYGEVVLICKECHKQITKRSPRG